MKYLDPVALRYSALKRYRDGFDPALIELPERAVFPHLIPAQPGTARKSRMTGFLLGRPAPKFVRRGRSIRYRLADVLEWLRAGDAVADDMLLGELPPDRSVAASVGAPDTAETPSASAAAPAASLFFMADPAARGCSPSPLPPPLRPLQRARMPTLCLSPSFLSTESTFTVPQLLLVR